MKKSEKEIIKSYIKHYGMWANQYYEEGNTEMSEWALNKVFAIEELMTWLEVDIYE